VNGKMMISVTPVESGYEVVNELLANHPKHKNHEAAQPRISCEVQLWLRTEVGDKLLGHINSGSVRAAEWSFCPTTKVSKIFIGLGGEKVVSCAVCLGLSPKMFIVPNGEWEKYVIPALQDKWLCRLCYDDQKKLFPNGWKKIGV